MVEWNLTRSPCSKTPCRYSTIPRISRFANNTLTCRPCPWTRCGSLTRSPSRGDWTDSGKEKALWSPLHGKRSHRPPRQAPVRPVDPAASAMGHGPRARPTACVDPGPSVPRHEGSPYGQASHLVTRQACSKRGRRWSTTTRWPMSWGIAREYSRSSSSSSTSSPCKRRRGDPGSKTWRRAVFRGGWAKSGTRKSSFHPIHGRATGQPLVGYAFPPNSAAILKSYAGK